MKNIKYLTKKNNKNLYTSTKKKDTFKRYYSSKVVDGIERAPSRGMLHALGFKKDDFRKPQIGIASTWSMVTPCNMHINRLAEFAEKGVNNNGGKSVIFNTITVSDGISMGTEGMKYSLVSREIIADSIETVVGCQGFDGVLAIGGCDKNMPGCIMAICRLNRPAIFVYGGTILPGKYEGKDVDIVSIFESVGKYTNHQINLKELEKIESCAIPGPGSCGGMYTANTMASAIEAMGMSLPYSSTQTAISTDKKNDSQKAGEMLMRLISNDIKPLDIITKKSLENAYTVVCALGGSTNAILHLLAIANAANIRLSLNDFTRIGKKTPVLADLKPSGKYLMVDFIKEGGLPPFMKVLLDKGLLYGECLTVTGRTIAENLKNTKTFSNIQNVVRNFNHPIKQESHLVILKGNLAPEGAVAKISGKEGSFFKGRAKVFNSEEKAMESIMDHKIKKGDIVLIRYEGPKGGPGMREMLGPTSAIVGKGLGKDVALITDGRFSGGSHGFVIGHISPEAYCGGPIAVIKNGDIISIDAKKREINLNISAREMQERLKKFKTPKPNYKKGVLSKYAASVSSASLGAVTDIINAK